MILGAILKPIELPVLTLVPLRPAEKLMDRSALSYWPLLSSHRGDSFRNSHMGTMRALSTDPYHQMTRQSWLM